MPNSRTPRPLDPVAVAHAVGFLRRLGRLAPKARQRLLKDMPKTEEVRRLLAAARKEIRFAEENGCSVPVIEATTYRGERFVVRGRRRSREKTRIGDAEGTLPTTRLMPAHAVELEDYYDGLSPFAAAILPDPPSHTGLQMRQWGDHLALKAKRQKARNARRTRSRP